MTPAQCKAHDTRQNTRHHTRRMRNDTHGCNAQHRTPQRTTQDTPAHNTGHPNAQETALDEEGCHEEVQRCTRMRMNYGGRPRFDGPGIPYPIKFAGRRFSSPATLCADGTTGFFAAGGTTGFFAPEFFDAGGTTWCARAAPLAVTLAAAAAAAPVTLAP